MIDDIHTYVFGKSSPDGSEMHVPGNLRTTGRKQEKWSKRATAKGKRIKAESRGPFKYIKPFTSSELSPSEKIAYATNSEGMVAGPAATGMAAAAMARNEGGLPRMALRRIGGGKPERTRTVTNLPGGRRAVKVVETNKPATKGPRKAAIRVADYLDSAKSKPAKAAALAAGGTMVGLQGFNWFGDSVATRMIERKSTGNWGNDKKKPVAKSDGHDLTWEGEIAKADEDKRQVFGWCSLTHVDGQPVIDRQGDYIPLEEVEKAAYDYVIKSRKGGDEHRRDGDAPLHTSDMIESFVVTPEKLEAMGMGPDAMPSGWWIGFKVNDDEQWERVRKGQRQHFSIHGRGRRTDTSEDEIMAKHTRSRR